MISLGIDCGTQSLKTLALEGESGVILATAQQPYGLLPGLAVGHQEQHPETWWKALRETVVEVLGSLGSRRREVGAIGVSGQQHGLVPLDVDHQVIRPAKLWCDTSTTAQCEEIRNRLGGRAALLQRIGNDMLPGFTAPKILWLKQNEPSHYTRLAHVALPHDFLNLRLTGNLRMEYGDASGTALMDVRRRVWSREVCAAIDDSLMQKLPSLGSSREACGRLRNELRQEWGLGEVVVSAGGGDNMMAAIGTGNVRPGVCTASLGTSGTIFACSNQPVIDRQGEIAAFCDSNDLWLPLVCTMNVTVATELFRTMFSWDHARMDREIASVPPGAGGLLFFPYLQGERTPNLPAACGILDGMTTANSRPDYVARAVMEGVTLGMAYGLQRMKENGVKPDVIHLTGGGSRSPVWRQICADVFGVPVVALGSFDGAALGAAIQALATAHGAPVEAWITRFPLVDVNTQLEPGSVFDYAHLLDSHNRRRDAFFPPS